MNDVNLNPAEELTGLTLDGGWQVIEKCRKSGTQTGGCFSVGYIVERDGQKAYLKALDFYSTLRIARDPARSLQPLIEAFNFERDLLAKCRNRRLSRVIVALDDGAVRPSGTSFPYPVQYIVFELADGDVRSKITPADRLDIAWAFRTLHQIAVGLQQLHGIGVAHQDTKPSNVLLFKGREVSKLADVGSASTRGESRPFEDRDYLGDPTYAPPELRYGAPSADWGTRSIGCDVYHLGSMIVWMFTMTAMTQILLMSLPQDMHPEVWESTYDDVLPYLRSEYEDTLEYLNPEFPEGFRDDLTDMVRQLCDPDPAQRGHPRNHQEIGSPYSLERYISKLDRLAKTAEFRLVGEI